MPSKFRNAACLVILLFSIAVAHAADAPPASQPATRPANIDQVVTIKPITLKTKGLMPAEAFAALSRETGIQFTPAKTVSSGMGMSRNINLWTDRPYTKIDFDLESASFWQATDRLCEQAQVSISGAEHSLTLLPGYRSPISPQSQTFDGPIARVHAIQFPGSHSESRINDEPPVITDVPPGLEISIKIDPRVILCAASAPVIEAALDPANHPVQFQPLRSGGRGLDPWEFSFLLTPQPKNVKSLKTLSGHIPVTVVTNYKSAKLPIEVGAARVPDAPWKIEIIDIKFIGSNVGTSTEVYLGVDSVGKNVPLVPSDFRTLVHLQDNKGNNLKPDYSFNDAEPRKTVTGGIRQRLNFWHATAASDYAAPATLVIDVPTDLKPAAIPFKFTDLPLP